MVFLCPRRRYRDAPSAPCGRLSLADVPGSVLVGGSVFELVAMSESADEPPAPTIVNAGEMSPEEPRTGSGINYIEDPGEAGRGTDVRQTM